MRKILLLIPAYRRMEAQATESACDSVKWEAKCRDASLKLAEALEKAIAAHEANLEAQALRLADTQKMVDWMCISHRLAPIFGSTGLPAAPPPPDMEPVMVSRPQAEAIEREFNKKFAAAVHGLAEDGLAN